MKPHKFGNIGCRHKKYKSTQRISTFGQKLTKLLAKNVHFGNMPIYGSWNNCIRFYCLFLSETCRLHWKCILKLVYPCSRQKWAENFSNTTQIAWKILINLVPSLYTCSVLYTYRKNINRIKWNAWIYIAAAILKRSQVNVSNYFSSLINGLSSHQSLLLETWCLPSVKYNKTDVPNSNMLLYVNRHIGT